ncbi:Hypothetical_protein [Hexamita inflata]|uniref:Hypothetical_protein n=1 Tax=Hexamita inflata TaxID=28002 RepID=A0AA86U331_9EUKA|nr:Hypothetical protein HINF_LOCUS26294 [Hexamita inflata]
MDQCSIQTIEELNHILNNVDDNYRNECGLSQLMIICSSYHLFDQLDNIQMDSIIKMTLTQRVMTDHLHETALLKLLQCSKPVDNMYKVAESLQLECGMRSLLSQTPLHFCVLNYNPDKFSKQFLDLILRNANITDWVGETPGFWLGRSSFANRWQLYDQLLINMDCPNCYQETALEQILNNDIPIIQDIQSVFQRQLEVQNVLNGSCALMQPSICRRLQYPHSVQLRLQRQRSTLQTHGGLLFRSPRNFWRDPYILSAELSSGLEMEDSGHLGIFLENLMRQKLIKLYNNQGFEAETQDPALDALVTFLNQNFKRAWETRDPLAAYYAARNGVMFEYQLPVCDSVHRNVYQVFFIGFLERFTETYPFKSEAEFQKLFVEELKKLPKAVLKPKNTMFLIFQIVDSQLSQKLKDEIVHKINVLSGGYATDAFGLDTSQYTSKPKTKAEKEDKITPEDEYN